MFDECMLRHLQVNETFKCNNASITNLQVDNLEIKSNKIDSYFNTDCAKVKSMYERNTNTNCYTDDDKRYLNTLKQHVMHDENTLYQKEMQVYVPDDVDYDMIKDGYGIWCYNNNHGLIFKFKKGNKRLYYKTVCEEWKCKVRLYCSQDKVHLFIDA